MKIVPITLQEAVHNYYDIWRIHDGCDVIIMRLINYFVEVDTLLGVL